MSVDGVPLLMSGDNRNGVVMAALEMVTMQLERKSVNGKVFWEQLKVISISTLFDVYQVKKGKKTYTRVYCFQRHARSIVDDDQEQFLTSHNTVYFPPAFPPPICAYNCNCESATLDNYYGVPLLGISIKVVHRNSIQSALCCGVDVAETGGAFDSELIY